MTRAAASRSWLGGVLVAFCLLIVPALAWLLLPGPPDLAAAPPGPRTVAAADPGETEPDEPAAPAARTPRPARSASAPRAGDGAVRGRVLDDRGTAVRSAWVGCTDKPDHFATTDDEGRFSLSSEAAGCDAYATHPDYGKSPSVRLAAGDGNDVEFASPGGISGFVVDEGGRPITSFLLAVESFEPRDPDVERLGGRARNIEDPAGAFTLSKLAAGRYVLVASADGRPPSRSDPVEVEAGRNASARITLSPGGTLRGRVTDRGTGAPIENARVRLDAATSTGANAIRAVTTDATGSYTLEGVPNGPFSVRVSHPTYRERVSSFDGSGGRTVTGDVDLAPRGDGPASELSGIGATLMQAGSFVEIASVLAGGPAEQAGVQRGDRIERIDGRSAEGFTVSQCVQLLRGPEGSRVSVTLGRGTSTLDVSITRAMITR